jgi:hypothetical protein
MAQVRVPGFLPSTSALHFPNSYPHEPQIEVKLPLGHTLQLGDAANGLCGGMVFVVRDYYEARRPAPTDTQPPPAGSPLYKFIVSRLLDSFNLPFGLNRYLELMEPAFPDVGIGFGRDDVQIQLSVASAQVPVPLTYAPTEAVYCFFRTPYTSKVPPIG